MIFVDRNNIQAPSILTDSQKKGQKEKQKAIAHYSTPLFKAFNFTVYRDSEVKDALVKLFKGKCAYCESKFLHIYPGDVEHFRPKGEIEEANPPKKPGYYWLASDWDNLLLSCRNCNQKLRHFIYGQNNRISLGKMNQFPLSNENGRVRSHNVPNGIANEEPLRLLINPCIDMPEKHLEYDNIGVIRAKRINGILSDKALRSIEVYVLQRVPLVQARQVVLIEIFAQMQRVKEAVLNFNHNIDNQDTARAIFFNRIARRELERLNKFVDPKEEFSGMARQFVGEFMWVNFGVKI